MNSEEKKGRFPPICAEEPSNKGKFGAKKSGDIGDFSPGFYPRTTLNQRFPHLTRLEFVVTDACTGRCRHCSEGEHEAKGRLLDPDLAAKAVRDAASAFSITSVMTFGGEPLLHPDAVAAVHEAARACGIPKRQLITNGFFTKDPAVMRRMAERLQASGVNDVLLSVDAFHQETIPLAVALDFAKALLAAGIPSLKTQPAWLGNRDDQNPYNCRTKEVLEPFAALGIVEGEGNVVFPKGRARTELAAYFPSDKAVKDPYEEDPLDLRTVSVSPDSGVLGGSLQEKGILDLLSQYDPRRG